jgi:broad specificity phosphatase PhoE
MRIIELRRHTMRVMPGQHLSQEGVDLARRVGDTIGSFERVVTSTIPRAFETAIAMGFAVDEQLESLSMMGMAVDDEIAWDAGFAAWAVAARRGGAAGQYARSQAAIITEIARSLPDGGAALVISHGGIVEAQTIGCLPDMDFTGWGGYCSYCEGARLQFDGKRFVAGEVLRVNKDDKK